MTDAVLISVLVLRLLVPLGIPKFPLPFILAALVLDAADQTLLQAADATSVLDEYQDYDKALDVYYLTIAYTSTFRNWLDPVALGLARFLFYYRLAGTLAFALSGARPLLMVFPNTFEYFFVFYEAVRLLWDPSRLSRRFLLGAAAAIWVGIKLPQEYWIHVARLDLTAEIAAHPSVLPVLCAIGAGLLLLGRSRWGDLPPSDQGPSLDVDAHIVRPQPPADAPRGDLQAVLSVAVLEKVLLIATLAVIFSQILDVRATDLQIGIGVTVVVLLNSAISLWRLQLGSRYGSTVVQFFAMAAVNGGVLALGVALRRTVGLSSYLPVQDALFYLLLISLIITMYDRYRVMGNLSRGRPRLRATERAATA